MKVKPEYEEVAEWPSLMRQFLSVNGEAFGDFNADSIKCVAITNKERPDTKGDLYSLEKIKAPLNIFCIPVIYVVTVFQNDWDVLTPKQKGKIISRIMHSIIVEDDEPKIVPPDMKEHSVMIRTFGMDYMDNETTADPLTEKIEWQYGKQETPDDED